MTSNRARHTASMHTHRTHPARTMFYSQHLLSPGQLAAALHLQRRSCRLPVSRKKNIHRGTQLDFAAVLPRSLFTEPQLTSNATKRTKGGREDPAAHRLHAVSATEWPPATLFITVHIIWMSFLFLATTRLTRGWHVTMMWKNAKRELTQLQVNCH